MKESWRRGWKKKTTKNSASLNMCVGGKNSLPFLRALFISKCPAAKGKRAPCANSLGGTYWLSLGARKILCLLEFLLCSCFLQGSFGLISPAPTSHHHAYTSLGTPEISKDSPCSLLCTWNHRGFSLLPHLCILLPVHSSTQTRPIMWNHQNIASKCRWDCTSWMSGWFV